MLVNYWFKISENKVTIKIWLFSFRVVLRNGKGVVVLFCAANWTAAEQHVLKHVQSFVHQKVELRSLERIHSTSLMTDHEFTENNNWQIHWRKSDLEPLLYIDSLAGVNFLNKGFFKHLAGCTCGVWRSDGSGYQNCLFSEMWRHAPLYIDAKFSDELVSWIS